MLKTKIKKKKISKKLSKKRRNPIEESDLSEEELDKFDALLREIDYKIKSESEMKYKNEFIIKFLKELKSHINSESSFDNMQSNIVETYWVIKQLKEIIN